MQYLFRSSHLKIALRIQRSLYPMMRRESGPLIADSSAEAEAKPARQISFRRSHPVGMVEMVRPE
jgi:hypothetical protein